jgi:fucose permease
MLRTLPIFLAFLVMGVADAMGPMSDAVKTQYKLSDLMATLLPFFVFIAFAVFSVPGGLLAARIGKKKLLLVGLGLNAVAMPHGARVCAIAGMHFRAGHRHDVFAGQRQPYHAGCQRYRRV